MEAGWLTDQLVCEAKMFYGLDHNIITSVLCKTLEFLKFECTNAQLQKVSNLKKKIKNKNK